MDKDLPFAAYISINTAAERADICNVPDVGEAAGCSGVATESWPEFGTSTWTLIALVVSRFTTTTARLPFAPTKTVYR